MRRRPGQPGEPCAQVWLFAVDVAPEEQLRLASLLDAPERERAARFRFPDDRRRFVVTRGRLRELLSTRLGVRAKDVEIETNALGRPALRSYDPTGAFDFNVSHSGSFALVGFGAGVRIGVDLELHRGDLDVEGISTEVFSRAERETLAHIEGDRRLAAFFAGWTRKEALVKAMGQGLRYPLDQIVVELAAQDGQLLQSLGPLSGLATGWTVMSLDLPAGYSGAVALQNLSDSDVSYGLIAH